MPPHERARRTGRASRALAVEHDYRLMATEVRDVYARVVGSPTRAW